MTEEDKKLLLNDLCSRLQYNVIVSKSVNGHKPVDYYLDLYKIAELQDGDAVIIKPYLRPMSSMTDEERKQYNSFSINGEWNSNYLVPSFRVLDWLNEHHIDYRGLIEKCLALEAPEDMYKND